MVRVLVAFGLLVFVLLLAVGSWMTANRQLAEAWHSCAVELKVEERLRQPGIARDGAAVTRLLADMVDCADQRKGFLADLFFGRDTLLERYETRLRALAIEQAQLEDQLRRYEEQQQELLDAYEGERNLQEFRQGVYRNQR